MQSNFIIPKATVLEEVLVAAVRVQSDAPVAHSNLPKKKLLNGI